MDMRVPRSVKVGSVPVGSVPVGWRGADATLDMGTMWLLRGSRVRLALCARAGVAVDGQDGGWLRRRDTGLHRGDGFHALRLPWGGSQRRAVLSGR
ncbi:MAG: hypothetical protein AUI15_20395 [Actinobacteria bacterium 13_2_20CM_2_66_6]|nr:MAG: hypothetical protein AUI15_20395 [Actinobacteria bacterium 13_2_20CM_2_66_6]